MIDAVLPPASDLPADAPGGRPHPSHSYDVLDRLHPLVPQPLIEVARSWDHDRVPVAPRLSASVVLLRDGAAGLETYLLQRQASMPFAPLMSVFPGGSVDPVDDPRDPLLFCAVRETTEETGVQLTPDALLPWARWITPVVAPMRFDTTFFLAACPSDQEPRNASTEADAAGWWTLPAVLEAFRIDGIRLMPPTLSVVLELAECADLAAVRRRADGRIVAPVCPQLRWDGDTFVYSYPAR